MIIHTRRMAFATLAVLLSYFPASSAIAADASEQAVMTLDETLKVPGATLDAGAYIFEMMNVNGSPEVKIVRATDNKVMTTAKVVRVERPGDAGGLAIEVAMPRGDAEWPTLKGWSYAAPGGSYEFIFSKSQEKQLNDATEIPIAPPAS